MKNPYSLESSPSDVALQVAANFKKLRKQKGFTQVEVAERSGVSYGSVKRFELTGHISFLSLLQLAHVLGSLNEFENVIVPQKINEVIDKLFSKKLRK